MQLITEAKNGLLMKNGSLPLIKPLKVLNAKLDIWTKAFTVQYSQPNTQALHATTLSPAASVYP